MKFTNKRIVALFSLITLAMLGVIAGCTRQAPEESNPGAISPPSSATVAQADGQHGHIAGAHGGAIVALGQDSYHVEPIFESGGKLTLYTLQADETKVLEVDAQTLSAFAINEATSAPIEFEIQPDPLPDDSPNKTSRFVATIPESLLGGSTIKVTIPSFRIDGDRFRLSFSSPEQSLHAFPEKVEDSAERDLYLTPGGVYTSADIEANGNQTASQKFRNFEPAHDLHPQPGDKICPITLTKANPKCNWIIGGTTYEFCCPPCVDEFVKLAKTEPEAVKPPTDFVQK